MLIRYLASATMGIVVTCTLLFLMQTLIDSAAQALEESPRHKPVTWVRLEKDERIMQIPPMPSRPPDPEEIPPAPPVEPMGNGGKVISIPPAPLKAPGPSMLFRPFEMTDGPLVNVTRVTPQYPIHANVRGLEGVVTVQFDVNAAGAVENALVVESSNTIFNKAAVKAIYKFRYKPRVVDGQPIVTRGLRNRFRFRMPD